MATLMAAQTSRLGIVPTLSTFAYPPYLLARLVATLDQVSAGRIGWNMVTGSSDHAAMNYGLPGMPEHDLRYDMADEYMACVNALWDSWDPDAIIADAASGVLVDPARVRQVDFDGRWYKSRGPLNSGPCPQGRPVIAQAGGSPRGKRFAALHADTVVASVKGTAGMRAYRDELRAAAVAQGRDPGLIKVLFLVSPTIGETDAEAQLRHAQKMARAAERVPELLAFFGKITNINFAEYDLDTPVADLHLTTNGHQQTLDDFRKVTGRKTLRQAMLSYRGNNGSVELVGSPDTVAARMAEVMEEVGGDGFLITTADTSRRVIAEICDGLVPALQARGLARRGVWACAVPRQSPGILTCLRALRLRPASGGKGFEQPRWRAAAAALGMAASAPRGVRVATPAAVPSCRPSRQERPDRRGTAQATAHARAGARGFARGFARALWRRSAQQVHRFPPDPLHHIAGRLGAGQHRRLAGPGLHALHVTGAHRVLAHRRGQAALHRVGGDRRAHRGAQVVGGDAARRAPAHRPRHHRLLGARSRPGHRPRPAAPPFPGSAGRLCPSAPRWRRAAAPPPPPRPSAMPPVAISGRPVASATAGISASPPTMAASAFTLSKRPAMAARLHALHDQRIGPGRGRRTRLGQAGDGGEPGDAGGFHPGDECRLEHPHDRADDRRPGGQQRLALRVEVGQGEVGRARRRRRPPLAQEGRRRRLVRRVARRRRVGDPQVELEGAVGRAAHPRHPGGDGLRGHLRRPQRPHRTGIGRGDGEPGGVGAGHRPLQDRHPQTKAGLERLEALGDGAVHPAKQAASGRSAQGRRSATGLAGRRTRP